jgi:ADP-heptose:LPS heptosyltransferase
MHTLTNTKPIHAGNLFGNIMPGSWLMHDRTAFELGVMAERGAVSRIDKFDGDGIRGTGKRVLIMRSGAFGDLLLASPAIEVFKALNQGIHLTLCCLPSRAQLFGNTGLFDEIVDYPMPVENVRGYDQIIDLGDVIETSDKHATDAFAEALHVSVLNYRPSVKLTAEELGHAKRHFNGTRKKVAVQLRAGVANRDYPAHLWQPVLLGLEEAGWEVMLLGTRGQIPPMPPPLRRPYIREIYLKDLSFRESAAVIANCDLFIGPDSSLLHVAHAVGVKSIGLFGPINPAQRVSPAQPCHALQGAVACKGCGWNYHNGHHFPSGKPCAQKRLCDSMAAIDPQEILRLALAVDGNQP